MVNIIVKNAYEIYHVIKNEILPAFVTFSSIGMTDLQYRLIAFAGPFVNLVLFLVAMVMLRDVKNKSRKEVAFWAFTKKLNLLLFIFNIY